MHATLDNRMFYSEQFGDAGFQCRFLAVGGLLSELRATSGRE
jgi:hypothetical protein